MCCYDEACKLEWPLIVAIMSLAAKLTTRIAHARLMKNIPALPATPAGYAAGVAGSAQ